MFRFLLSLLFLYSFSFAFLAPKDQTKYLQSDLANGNIIIYPESFKPYLKEFVKSWAQIDSIYSQEFGYKPKNVAVKILSNNYQISNAFAFIKEAWLFSNTPALASLFDQPKFSVFIHELAHVYQLSAQQQRLNQIASTVLGDSFLSIIGLPFFPYPNIFIPNLFTEGNAVLNEGRFKVLGRLQNPTSKMRVGLLARQGKLANRAYLMHPSRDNFFDKSYLIGGNLNAFLARKYGLAKLQQFFYNYSSHYLLAPLFAYHYKQYFGNDLDDDLKAFENDELENSQNMQLLKGKVLAKSAIHIPSFGKSNDKIFFAAHHIQSPSQIFSINQKTAEVSLAAEGDFALRGQIFKLQDQFYINTSQQHNVQGHIAQGLFDNAMNVATNTLKKYIIHYEKQNQFYIPVQDFGQELVLYHNQKPVAKLDNSNVIVDDQHNFYHSKSNVYTNKTNFYQNNKLLFSLNSGQIKLSDADAKALYFIAASRYGSSLFAFNFQSKNIYRLSPADNILDARKVNDKTFLAFVANTKSNDYVLFKPKIIKQKPFVNQELKSFTANKANVFSSNKTYSFQTKSYNPLTALRYKSTDLVIGDGLSLETTFSDPLMANAVNFSLLSNDERSEQALFYSVSGLMTSFSTGFSHLAYAKQRRSSAKLSYNLQLNRPLLKSGRHNVNASYKLGLPLSHSENIQENNISRSNTIQALRFNYNFTKSYLLDSIPNLSHQSTANMVLKDGNLSFDYRQDNSFGFASLGLSGHYLKSRLQVSFSKGDNLVLSSTKSVLDQFYLDFSDLYALPKSLKAHTAYLANFAYVTDFGKLLSLPHLSEISSTNQIASLGSSMVQYKRKQQEDFEHFNNVFARLDLKTQWFYTAPVDLILIYAFAKDNSQLKFAVKLGL